MAKLGSVSDETKELIEQLVADAGLENFLRVEVINIAKSKQLFKVAKANPTTEYLAKMPETVCIYVYEEAFDRLDDKAKRLTAQDAVASISFDTEKDKIIITQPQICVSLGGRMKYGEELLDAVEAGVLAIQQIEDEKKAEKEAKKKQ